MNSRDDEKPQCNIFILGDIESNTETRTNKSSSTSVSKAITGNDIELGGTGAASISINDKEVSVKIINNEPSLRWTNALDDVIKGYKIDGVIVTIDMTNQDAKNSLKNWLNNMKQDIPVFVIGTNSNNKSERWVTADDLKDILDEDYPKYKYSSESSIDSTITSLVSIKLEKDMKNKVDLLETIKDCIVKSKSIKMTEGIKDILKVIDDKQLTVDDKLKRIKTLTEKKHNSTSLFSHTDTNTNRLYSILKENADNPKKAVEWLNDVFPNQPPKDGRTLRQR